MSQPDSINLTTSHSANPQPSFLLLLHLLPHPPHSVASKVQMHTLTHTHNTLIKQQFSGSLFSRYTSKIKSPAGENLGEGRERKKKEKNGARQRDQLNYKNNAGWINWLFFSRVEPQCGMNLNGEE